jgi:hypothetical protein
MKFVLSIQGPKDKFSTYSLADLRREARNAVKGKGKAFGYTVCVHPGGNVSLIVSYETAPNQQTFTTVAL